MSEGAVGLSSLTCVSTRLEAGGFWWSAGCWFWLLCCVLFCCPATRFGCGLFIMARVLSVHVIRTESTAVRWHCSTSDIRKGVHVTRHTARLTKISKKTHAPRIKAPTMKHGSGAHQNGVAGVGMRAVTLSY